MAHNLGINDQSHKTALSESPTPIPIHPNPDNNYESITQSIDQNTQCNLAFASLNLSLYRSSCDQTSW